MRIQVNLQPPFVLDSGPSWVLMLPRSYESARRLVRNRYQKRNRKLHTIMKSACLICGVTTRTRASACLLDKPRNITASHHVQASDCSVLAQNDFAAAQDSSRLTRADEPLGAPTGLTLRESARSGRPRSLCWRRSRAGVSLLSAVRPQLDCCFLQMCCAFLLKSTSAERNDTNTQLSKNAQMASVALRERQTKPSL